VVALHARWQQESVWRGRFPLDSMSISTLPRHLQAINRTPLPRSLTWEGAPLGGASPCNSKVSSRVRVRSYLCSEVIFRSLGMSSIVSLLSCKNLPIKYSDIVHAMFTFLSTF
jgi:hypothetical protein